MLHPLRGRWRGGSYPSLHSDCPREQGLIDPDSRNKAAIHPRIGGGCGRGGKLYLLGFTLCATFIVHIVSQEQNPVYFLAFEDIWVYFTKQWLLYLCWNAVIHDSLLFVAYIIDLLLINVHCQLKVTTSILKLLFCFSNWFKKSF